MSSTGDCFIFVTDTHYKGVNPVSRIDDYSASILEKLSEVVEAAEKENAACIIIGGDLNDIPRMADQQAGRLAEVLNRTRRCKFVVPGSHDLYGYSMDSLYQTKLGLLIKSGVVELLSRETGPVYIHLTDQVDGTVWRVSIEGQEFTSEIDTRDPACDYWVKSDAPISVLATHSMLLDKPFHPGVPQTLISDFPDSTEIEAIYGPGYRAPDVVLAGHYHPGWPIQKKGNTVFANPGSLARNSATPDSFTRTPSYVKGWIENGELKLEYVPIKCAKPAENVLDRTRLDDMKLRKDTIEEFKSVVGKNFNKTDVIGIIADIVLQDQLPLEIRERLFKRVRDAQALVDDKGESLKDFVPFPSNIWIVSARVQYFQSHEDTYVEFGPGLNAITGTNDQGKSAIMRALKWLFFDEPKGTRFISSFAGKKRTSVSILLSNGIRITRWRTKTNTGEYIIEYPDGQTKTFRADGVPPEVRAAIGMIPITLVKGQKAVLNIANQADPPFLVGLSGPAAAELIGRITHVEAVDKAIADINSEVQTIEKMVKAEQQGVEKEQQELQEALLEVAKLTRQVNLVSGVLDGIEDLENEVDLLKVMDADLLTLRSQEAEIKRAISECGNPDKAKEEILLAEAAYRTYDDLVNMAETYTSLKMQEAEIRDALSAIPDMTKALEEVNKAEEVTSFLRQIRQLAETYDRLIEEESNIRNALSEIGDITRAQEIISEAEREMATLATIRSLSEQLDALRNEHVTLTDDISAIDAELQDMRAEYAAIFEELGVCPFCMSTLSKEQIAKLGGGTHVA